MILITCLLISKQKILERNTDFIPLYGIKDSSYLPLTKNQKGVANCFIFAPVSSIEVAYGILTGTRYLLSAEQVANNIYDFFKKHDNKDNHTYIKNCIDNVNPTSEFGAPVCTLLYIAEKGIMSEYDYPYIEVMSQNKYNPKYVKPITVSDIIVIMAAQFSGVNIYFEQHIEDTNPYHYETGTENETYSYMHDFIVNHLSEKYLIPNVAMICGGIVGSGQIYDKYLQNCKIDHGVIITAVGHFPGDNDIYYEIVNSHGKSVGDEGKFYIKVFDDATKLFWNNGQILTRNIHFNISHAPLLPFDLSDSKVECKNCTGNFDFQKNEGKKIKIIYNLHIATIVIIGATIILKLISIFTGGSDSLGSLGEGP